jgi:uncharacterized protein
MLAGLGRWLRTAGHDTVIIEDSVDDGQILKRTLKENRILLTRDRHFLEMQTLKKEKGIIFLKGNSLEECIQELNRELKLNWLYAPFSRCLLCNSLLKHPDEQTILEQVPVDIRSQSSSYWYCEQCKKVYWQGSHTERMLKQLQQWQRN